MKKILLALLLTIPFLNAFAQRGLINPRLTELTNEKDSVMLKQKLDALYSSKEESDLTLLSSYYSSIRNRQKAEEISKLILQKYPDGLAAYNELFEAIYNERDPLESEKKYKELVRKWPATPTAVKGLGNDASRYYVAVTFLGKGKPDKVLQYLHMIQDTTYRTKAFSYAAREAIDAQDYALGEQLIRKTLADVAKKGGAKPQGYEEYLRIYSLLLYHNGKYDEGFAYAKELYNFPTQSDLSKKAYRNIYMNYLVAMNQLKEAYPFMEEQIRDGSGTLMMRNKFKEAYIAAKGEEAGYGELIAGIDAGLKQKVKIELAKKMRAEPAFNFTMKDLTGKTVRLSDYKGKVVILDFWATWCGPCKASFPMMQKAVNQFKGDTNVVFLFIHTMETSPDAPKFAAEYIKEKKYTFNVLMDMKDPKTNSNPAAAGYKVSGIPSKFVIDKAGVIRFSSLGGGTAGEEVFLQEMAAMIEMAKG